MIVPDVYHTPQVIVTSQTSTRMRAADGSIANFDTGSVAVLSSQLGARSIMLLMPMRLLTSSALFNDFKAQVSLPLPGRIESSCLETI